MWATIGMSGKMRAKRKTSLFLLKSKASPLQFNHKWIKRNHPLLMKNKITIIKKIKIVAVPHLMKLR